MYKLGIKYVLPILIFSRLTFTQDSYTPLKVNTPAGDNELKMTLSNQDHFSRTLVETNNQIINPDLFLKFNEMMIKNNSDLKDNYLKDGSNEAGDFFIDPVKVKNYNNKTSKPKFNIISSFRENVHFGGFYERYAIIDFTPALNIKPFDFINLNAIQNYSCFVPISGIKEHFKTLFIQGAAILAVDNSIKLIFGADKMIPSLVGYAAKNIIITLLKSAILKKSPNQIYSNDSYNYSISIKF